MAEGGYFPTDKAKISFELTEIQHKKDTHTSGSATQLQQTCDIQDTIFSRNEESLPGSDGDHPGPNYSRKDYFSFREVPRSQMIFVRDPGYQHHEYDNSQKSTTSTCSATCVAAYADNKGESDDSNEVPLENSIIEGETPKNNKSQQNDQEGEAGPPRCCTRPYPYSYVGNQEARPKTNVNRTYNETPKLPGSGIQIYPTSPNTNIIADEPEASDDTSSSVVDSDYSEISNLPARHMLMSPGGNSEENDVPINERGYEDLRRTSKEERERIEFEFAGKKNIYQRLIRRRSVKGNLTVRTMLFGNIATCLLTTVVIVGLLVLLWHFNLFGGQPLVRTPTVVSFTEVNNGPANPTKVTGDILYTLPQKATDVHEVFEGQNATMFWHLPSGYQLVSCYDNWNRSLFRISLSKHVTMDSFNQDRYSITFFNSSLIALTLRNITFDDAGSYLCRQLSNSYNETNNLVVLGIPVTTDLSF